MPLFPSPAWMDEFGTLLEQHPEADAVASALDGIYRFVVEPAGPLRERHVYDMAIRPTGAGAKVERLDEPGEPPRLTLTADYGRWRQLILGQLDVGLALLLRRLKISGELGGVASRLSSTQPLIASLHNVQTEWLD